MDRQDLDKFIKGLDVNNLNIIREYEFDEPSNILVLEPKKILKVFVESKHGFMSFTVDEFRFDAIHQKLHLMFEGIEIYEAMFHTIKRITYEEVGPKAIAFERNKVAEYEVMYELEYGSYYDY